MAPHLFLIPSTKVLLPDSIGNGGVLSDTTQFAALPGRWGFDSAIDQQDRITVLGRRDEQNMLVVRFLPDGTRDMAFGVGGGTYVPTLGAGAMAVRVVLREDGSMLGLASTNSGAQWFVLDADGVLLSGTNALAPLPSSMTVTDLSSAPNGRWLLQSQGAWPLYDQHQVRMSDTPVFLPHIAWNGTQLITTGSGTGFQWFLDGEMIPGSSGTSHTPELNGAYTVAMTDDLGCTVMSPPFVVISAGSSETPATHLRLVNSLVDDRLIISNGLPEGLMYKIMTMSGSVVGAGRLLTGNNAIDVVRLTPGA